MLMTHLYTLVWSLVATLMVIYGGAIHQRIRRLFRGLPILARFFAFVVICAAGYGWLSIMLVRLTVDVLSQCSPSLVLACVSGGFLLVGWLAQRRRLI